MKHALIVLMSARADHFLLIRLTEFTAVRLKVEQNQLVDVFGEIGVLIDGLKGA
jgi:hypothetical protein